MIALNKLHDLKPFVSTDDNRPILQSVHIRPDRGIVEATNRHIMIEVPLNTEFEDDDFPCSPGQGSNPKESLLIPIDALNKALKSIPTKNNIPVIQQARLTETGDNGTRKGVLSTTDLESSQDLSFRIPEGPYPNTDKVYASKHGKKAECKITLSPEYLIRIGQYAKKHGGAERGLHFTFYGGSTGAEFEFQTHDSQTVRGLIMPMRDTR